MRRIAIMVALMMPVTIARAADLRWAIDKCGSPACIAAGDDPDARRLDAAWKASATTAEQKQAMQGFIERNASGPAVAWKVAADSYFKWRSEEYPNEIGGDRFAKQRKLVTEAILRSLVDPDSAKFEWSGLFYQGEWWKTDLFRKRIVGEMTCGWVNAKNRMGGYAGRTAFSAAVSNGAVIHLSIDDSPGGLNEYMCKQYGHIFASP